MHRGQLQTCSTALTAYLLIILGAASCQDVISAPSPTFDDTPTSLDALLPEAALPGDDKPDSYLCTSIRLPADTLQLTAFEPLANSNAATSMMLYGVFSAMLYWACVAGVDFILPSFVLFCLLRSTLTCQGRRLLEVHASPIRLLLLPA